MSRIFIQILIDLFLSARRQGSQPFLHNNLLKFLLIDHGSETTPEDLAYFVRHMPILQKLFVFIYRTQHEPFARLSYFEEMLPQTLVKFQFSTRFTSIISNHIDDKIIHRFPMKIHNNIIYTVPWEWCKLPWTIPLGDYHQTSINRTKRLYFCHDQCQNEISADALKFFNHVTRVKSIFKLPSLDLFSCLRELITEDADVVHSILPPTLRSLELTGKLF